MLQDFTYLLSNWGNFLLFPVFWDSLTWRRVDYCQIFSCFYWDIIFFAFILSMCPITMIDFWIQMKSCIPAITPLSQNYFSFLCLSGYSMLIYFWGYLYLSSWKLFMISFSHKFLAISGISPMITHNKLVNGPSSIFWNNHFFTKHLK